MSENLSKRIAELEKDRDSLLQEREEWRSENSEQHKRFDALSEQVEALKSIPRRELQESSDSVGDLVKMLANAATPGGRIQSAKATGKTVEVSRGDFIHYNTIKGGNSQLMGGWFKCSEDTEATYNEPYVAIANVQAKYDDGVGIPRHQIENKPYKRFYQDRGSVMVAKDKEPGKTVDELRKIERAKAFGVMPSGVIEI